MSWVVIVCPNTECPHGKRKRKQAGRFYIKKGYYVTRYNHQRVPRYECKHCGKRFSSHTFRPTFRQKKPHLNRRVYEMYCSSVTQRRISLLLGIDRKTVVRKFLFMAVRAKQAHQQALSKSQVSDVQFDEMETFEHTRLKPLSIALAVQPDGRILAAKVAQMPYKGPLATIAKAKYGYRHDDRPSVRKDVFSQLKALGVRTLTTDAHPAYAGQIRKYLPQTQHIPCQSQDCHPVKRLANRRRNIDDPLFAVNHAAARIRHDLSRMLRRVWTTTKKAERLQAHLDLFVAFHNGCFI